MQSLRDKAVPKPCAFADLALHELPDGGAIRAGQEKSPARMPGLKVWERMPERHFAYAALQTFVQVRKLHIKLHKMQLWVDCGRFYAKHCTELPNLSASRQIMSKYSAGICLLHRNMNGDSPLRLARRDSAPRRH
jgi:hypothetical protein